MSKATEIITRLKASDKPAERYIKYKHLGLFLNKDKTGIDVYAVRYIGTILDTQFHPDLRNPPTVIDRVAIKELME